MNKGSIATRQGILETLDVPIFVKIHNLMSFKVRLEALKVE